MTRFFGVSLLALALVSAPLTARADDGRVTPARVISSSEDGPSAGAVGRSDGVSRFVNPIRVIDALEDESGDGDPLPEFDDGDGDGTLDAFDNCLLHPNSQRDPDRDGFGNRCDPDLDNDGDVDDVDRSRLESAIVAGAAGPLEERTFDLDENGVLDDGDLAIVDEFLGGAPGPKQDTDGDGTPDSDDRCPATPAGVGEVGRGCSALDAMQWPEKLTGPVGRDTADLAERLSRSADRAAAVFYLDEAAVELDNAAAAVRGGDPCGADGALSVARTHFESARSELDLVYENRASEVPPLSDEEHVTGADLAAVEVLFEQDAVDDLIARNDALGGEFETLCGDANPYSGSGIVERVDDALGRMVLEDGRVLGFNGTLQLTGDPGPGSDVAFNGYDFGSASGTQSLFSSELDCESAGPPPGIAPCVQFRFVPIQRFAGIHASGPHHMFYPEAYEIGGRHRFERGMRFAAKKTCTSDIFQLSFKRHSLKLTLLYWTTPSQVTPFTEVVALDLEPGDEPVGLASYFESNPFDRMTIRAETFQRSCTLNVLQNVDCLNPVKVHEREYPLEIVERGSQCGASYAETEFAIDDQDQSTWTQTWITSVTSGFPTTAPLQFKADGFEMCPEGSGFKPCSTPSTIYAPNHSFVLRSWDYFPVGPTLSTDEIENSYPYSGVDHAAGLSWPRVRGVNNGHTWQFSCNLPRVVRDYVNIGCSGATDAFYRLPFSEEGEGQWTNNWKGMNGPGVTHSAYWAYDMEGTCGETIRTARAGKVVQVRNTLNCKRNTSCSGTQCGSPCCTAQQEADGEHWGNVVTVRHQDESEAVYLHMQLGGVAVQQGEMLARGEIVGSVGTTGRSSGPHLHFQVTDSMGNNALGLFECENPNNSAESYTCHEPDNGEPLRSNNQPAP